MADATPRRSPLDAYARRLAAAGDAVGLWLAEIPLRMQLTVRAQPGSPAAAALERALGLPLPVTPGTTT